MISIDTGARFVEVTARSSAADDTQSIRITTPARARTEHKKIRANIEAHECPEQLSDYWHRESLILDALHLFDPAVAADLREAFETHRAVLQHGGAPDPHRTVSGIPTAHNGNNDKDKEDEFYF